MSPIRIVALPLFVLPLFAGCGGPLSPAERPLGSADRIEVPAALTVPAGNDPSFKLQGVGVQIYTCKVTASGGYAWAFVAPKATLYNPGGNEMGLHFAGPTWESEQDGSEVVGAKRAAVTVDPTAIPWLLLQAVAHNGDGRMSTITWIQRLETVGGLAPASGCDADHVGQVANVDYSATYAFWEASGS